MTVEQMKPEKCACREAEEAVESRVTEILEYFQGNRNELIPILQQVQGEFGYLPAAAMSKIARFLHIPDSIVFGVATFYAQFRLVPVGRTIIKVCRGTGCHVRGAPQILNELESKLGIKSGQTTPDMEYTLEEVACFGSCALAPVVVINDQVHGRMTPSKSKKAVDDNTTTH
jgi:NADH-quinone oxidoreductase subunit E